MSIVIPTRNLERYLSACLDSIERQERLFPFEILCVDDSTDGTRALLDAWRRRLPITILTPQREGVGAARNRGLAAATGRFVWFIDGDDRVAPNAFRILSDRLGEEDVTLFGAKVISYDESFVLPDITPPTFLSVGECLGIFFDHRTASPYVWNALCRRDFLAEKGLTFPEECRTGEDAVFRYFSFERAKRVRGYPDSVYEYHYMRNPASLIAARRGKEGVRLEESLRALSLIARNRERGRCDALFGRWAYGYLLAPILCLSERTERERLMRLVRRSLLTECSFDFSGLSRRDRFKCRCFRSGLWMWAYCLYRRIRGS